jgi:hypothetical protein
MPGWAFLKRITATVPELDEADKRAGATFVNILFALVVTTAATLLAKEFVHAWAKGWDSINEARIANLLVAITLTVLSWIGYHQSQQYPPFLIKFLNIPFFQFFLDVSMVVLYYVVVLVAEDSNPTRGRVHLPDALPEAVLVLSAFFLYSCWDTLGFLLFHDPQYSHRLKSPRAPDARFGARRKVTVVFTMLATVQALLIWCLRPRAVFTVIVADAAIITFLFVYRICKQGFDSKVKTRDQVPLPRLP